jgi:hypothetical protein
VNGRTTFFFKGNVLKTKAFQINGIHKEIDNAHKAVGVNHLIQTEELHLIAWFAFNVVHRAVVLFNCIKISNLTDIRKRFLIVFSTNFSSIFQTTYSGDTRSRFPVMSVHCLFKND